jgi:ribonuclease P protein component
MLKKANRINKTRDLQKVYRLGKSVHTSALVIKFVAGPKTQIAFVVSKKVSKRAVQRNRIKRVLREQMRLGLQSNRLGKYVVIVKPNAAALDNSQIREELKKSLAKIPATFSHQGLNQNKNSTQQP